MTTRSTLLYHQDEDDCYFNQASSYKRSNILRTASFRNKYKGFRTRSSSYTSLEDENKITRAKLGERSVTVPTYTQELESEEEFEEDSDENTFFAKQSSYSRQNIRSSSSSWKSCVLRAVGVKRSK